MSLKDIRNSMQSADFARNTAVLSIGALISQLLTFSAYPLLTRLFSPAEFGVLAIVQMMAALLAVLASGAAEGAILLAHSRRLAATIIGWVAFRSSIILTFSLGIFCLLYFHDVSNFIDPQTRSWLPAIPVVAGTSIAFNCFSEWSVREKSFLDLTKYRIIQSLLVSVAKLMLGAWGLKNFGLVAGDIGGKTFTAMAGLWSVFRVNRKYFSTISRAGIRQASMKYRNFPRYMMPDQLVNIASGTLHVPFFVTFFSTAELGLVSITFSMLYLPVVVVSTAIKDVFRQRVALEIREKGDCRPLYLRLLLVVVCLGVLGFGFLFYISGWIFSFLLGTEWSAVGEYARIMIPMFFFNFVSMSMGGVLVATQRLGVSLVWQIVSVAFTVVALVIGTMIFKTVGATLISLSIVRSISYVIYMFLSYYFAGSGKPDQILKI